MTQNQWKNRIIRQETVSISDIVPNAKNWRKHPVKQQTHVKGSLDNLGWIRSVLVNLRTSEEWQVPHRNKKTVIDGHLRLDLALKNGEDKIPVEYVDLSPDEEKIALASIDPLAAMAETDEKMLDDLLSSIDCDVPEITDMLGDIGTLEGIEQDEPEPLDTEPQINRAEELRKEWGTELGQLWQCGDHRVICGDCTDPAVVARVGGGEAGIMVTDPPYGVEYDPEWRAKAGINKNKGKMGVVQNDNVADWSPAWALFTGDVAYVWHAGKFASEVQQSLSTAGFGTVAHIIWKKDRFALSRGDYHWQHEPCWYAVRAGQNHQWAGARDQSTVWDIARADDSGHGHGTQKPIECMLRPIKNHTSPVVYDPFLGSGTTMIACENLGRKCRGCEIDPGYVAVILQRYKDTFPGKEIKLIS